MNEELNNSGAATTFGLMKYVHLMYIVGTFLAGWLFLLIVDTAWVTANLEWAFVPPPNFLITAILGGGSAIALGAYLWRHPEVNRLVVEIVSELSKVTWPSRKELYASTIVVLVVSVIASIILGVFDAFWSWATTKLLAL